MEDKKKVRRWLVLLCAHISMLIFGGTYRSLGVFLVEWKEYFDTSSTQISAIITVLAASGLLSGIPSGILITKYGCHYGALLGAITFSIGTFTSVFAPNPYVLCFTMGFLTGLGVGPVRNSALVAIANEFKKGYSRANGVALAGGSIGMMLVPPLLQLCIDRYGWRGALLILVGIQLHLFVAVLIFRPPPPRGNRPEEIKTKSKQVVSFGANADAENELEPLRDTRGDDNERSCPDAPTNHAEHMSQSGDNNDKHLERKLNSSDDIQVNSHVDLEPGRTVDQSEIKIDVIDHDGMDNTHSDQGVAQTQNIINGDCKKDGHYSTKESDLNDSDSVAPTKKHGTTHQDSGLMESELLLNVCDEVRINEPEGPIEPYASTRRPSRVERGLNSSGLSLFCNNVGFCLFNLCQIMIGLCYTGILTHLVASAVYDGIDQQSASFLLTAFGISNLIARLGNGWMVDLQLLSPEYLYVLGVVVFGATMIVSRASSTYGWYVFVALLFGLSSGVFKTLNPVVLKKYVGIKYFARALGVFYASTGAGDLLGPIFTGALYDANNSYDLPFYVGGSVLIVSSGLLLLEPPLRRLKERRETRLKMDSDEDAV